MVELRVGYFLTKRRGGSEFNPISWGSTTLIVVDGLMNAAGEEVTATAIVLEILAVKEVAAPPATLATPVWSSEARSEAYLIAADADSWSALGGLCQLTVAQASRLVVAINSNIIISGNDFSMSSAFVGWVSNLEINSVPISHGTLHYGLRRFFKSR